MPPPAEAVAHGLLDSLRGQHSAHAASVIVQILAARVLLGRQAMDSSQAPLPALLDQAEAVWRAGKPVQDEASPFWNSAHLQRLSAPEQLTLLQHLDQLDLSDPDSPALVLELCLTLARRADTRGEFVSTSPLLNDVLIAVLKPIKGETAYCAYAGAAETAVRLGLGGVEVRLDLDRSLAGFWAAVATACDAPVRVTDAVSRLENPEYEPPVAAPYDLALVVPPINRRLEFGLTSEMVGIELALSAARRSVVVAPASVLFRTTGADQAFKARLLERRRLKAVAALPAGALLPHTNIASGLLVFGSAGSDGRVLMLDPSAKSPKTILPALFAGALAEDEETAFTRFIAPEEIAAQGFNLSPERYVLSPSARKAHEVYPGDTQPRLGRWPRSGS